MPISKLDERWLSNVTSEAQALEWVAEHRYVLGARVQKYLLYAPYGFEDYYQDARLAAIEAFRTKSKKEIAGAHMPFHGYFWNAFKDRVAEVVPFPGSKKNAGSSSVPCNWLIPIDNKIESMIADQFHPTFDPDCFADMLQFCSPRAGEALALHLGIGDCGQLTAKEIQETMGISLIAVRKHLQKAIQQLRKAAETQKLVNYQAVSNDVNATASGFLSC